MCAHICMHELYICPYVTYFESIIIFIDCLRVDFYLLPLQCLACTSFKSYRFSFNFPINLFCWCKSFWILWFQCNSCKFDDTAFCNNVLNTWNGLEVGMLSCKQITIVLSFVFSVVIWKWQEHFRAWWSCVCLIDKFQALS